MQKPTNTRDEQTIRGTLQWQATPTLQLKLRGGSRLKVSFAPAPDEEEEEETVQIKRMPNGRRVITGWEGFDAAKAVLEAREEHMQRLLGKSPQP